MAQIRGTAGYNLGGQQPRFATGPNYSHMKQDNSMTSDPSPLDQIREQTGKIEDWLDTFSEPIKPYLPSIGRLLIVATFLEDSLRIVTQWNDQLTYLKDYRNFPRGLNHVFLILNILAMVSCSFLIVARKYTVYAAGGLGLVIVAQSLGYGLIFDLSFFLRNLSVVGGLLMVLSSSYIRSKFAPAGLPQLEEKDRKMYIQLAGRVLLILLFLSFVWTTDTWSISRVLVSIVGFVVCVMVVVGFKTKASAILLICLLSIFNVIVNSFWLLGEHNPGRDFSKYDFFQILSIMGGLILLVDMGPGQFSVDEKKKVY